MGKGKHKHRVRISLSELDQPEISVAALLGHGGSKKKEKKKHKKKHKHDAGSSSHLGDYDDDEDPWTSGGFMTQLQQKYCGHARLQSDDEDDDDNDSNAAGTKKRKKRTAADDMYELDDDFIDDSELFEVFEKQEEAETVVTKYTGFFVNRGDLEIKEPFQRQESPKKEKKKRVRDKENGSGGAKENGGSSVAKKKAATSTGGSGSTTTTSAAAASGDNNSVCSNETSGTATAAKEETEALATFQKKVAAWSTSAQGIGVPDDLPNELALAALTLDLVMRRPKANKKFRSTMPGEAGLSAVYIETVLQATLPLAPGMDGGATAWRKGLVKVAVLRVREMKLKISGGLQEFRRQYNIKKEQLLNCKAPASKPMEGAGVGVEGGGEGGGGGGGDGMPAPAIPVPIINKLRQIMYTVLTSLKEMNAIQVLYAGQGEGQEETALLPLVPPAFAGEEMQLLTKLANTWPNDTMKIPRLRRAFNAYKAMQQQQQATGGGGAGGGGGGGGGGDAGSKAATKKARVQKEGAEGGAGAGPKKKPAKPKKKKPTAPWKGSFASLRSQPYNAVDFEVESAVKVAVSAPPPVQVIN